MQHSTIPVSWGRRNCGTGDGSRDANCKSQHGDPKAFQALMRVSGTRSTSQRMLRRLRVLSGASLPARFGKRAHEYPRLTFHAWQWVEPIRMRLRRNRSFPSRHPSLGQDREWPSVSRNSGNRRIFTAPLGMGHRVSQGVFILLESLTSRSHGRGQPEGRWGTD